MPRPIKEAIAGAGKGPTAGTGAPSPAEARYTTRPAPRYDTVFWDFNGTLLDDRDYAIAVRNRVFPAFGLPALSSVEEYHRQFTFPVRVYYERAGVTEETFETVANAWMNEYVRGADRIPLHVDALSTIQAFRQKGLGQVVLSASDVGILTRQLEHYGLAASFDKILGLSHIYATSKCQIGQEYLAACGQAPGRCVLLGDTLHDGDVARQLGMACILIARGHQSADTLAQARVPVVASLREAATLVLAGA